MFFVNKRHLDEYAYCANVYFFVSISSFVSPDVVLGRLYDLKVGHYHYLLSV